MDILLFIHFPVEGHLGYLRGLAIMNNSARKISIQILVMLYVFIYLG